MPEVKIAQFRTGSLPALTGHGVASDKEVEKARLADVMRNLPRLSIMARNLHFLDRI